MYRFQWQTRCTVYERKTPLLSAAKAEGIKVTPARLKWAIVNSAKVMDVFSCLQQGAGMIQVVKVWEYLQQYKDDSSQDVSTLGCHIFIYFMTINF